MELVFGVDSDFRLEYLKHILIMLRKKLLKAKILILEAWVDPAVGFDCLIPE